MNSYVGKCAMPPANKVVYVLPKIAAEGPNVARQRILRTVTKLAVAAVLEDGVITWYWSSDVARWWERANMDVVEAQEAGL